MDNTSSRQNSNKDNLLTNTTLEIDSDDEVSFDESEHRSRSSSLENH